jgi:hypothetical protein
MEIRHKRGDVREDGKVFWVYSNTGTAYWVNPEQFVLNQKKIAAKDKAYREKNHEAVKARCRTWHKKNRDAVIAYKKLYHSVNSETIKAKRKIWRKVNPDKVIAQNKSWYSANREKAINYSKSYIRNRSKNDPLFRMIHSLRSRLLLAFKQQNTKKLDSTFNLTGCTKQELRQHLVSQFRDGMTLENHGQVWHIDHIRPCASFDLSDKDQVAACFHHSNLQPLFAKENRMKSDKFQLV